jgi:hypothetical protein
MADAVGDGVKCLQRKGKPAVGIGMPTARAPGSEDARDQGMVSDYLLDGAQQGADARLGRRVRTE